MEKYNLKYILKHLNKKRIKEDLKTGGKYALKALGATAVVVGGTFGLATLSSCGASEKENNDKAIEQDAGTATDATTEYEVELADSSMLNSNTSDIEIEDENQEEYDKIDDLEEDIVDFAEESLPNGFIEVNEDNKLDMAERFTDGYVMMNLSTRDDEINKSTIKVLNQKGNLSARAIIDNYQKFIYQIGDYMQIVTPDTKINFENLVVQADDAKFLNNLEEEIAQMNVATTSEERQTRINNIIAIRDSIITDYATTSYSASTYYTAINMIIKADATAKAYGNKIFADEEAKVQIYTTLEKVCEEDYAGEYSANEFELDVESIGASQTSAESRYLNEIANFLKEAIESKDNQKYNEYYAYGQVTSRIAERIIGLYKAPEMDAVEKENSIREAASKANTPVGTTTTTTDVAPEDVPQEVREKDTTTTTDYSDNQSTDDADYTKDASESNDVYIQAKGAGITDGSAAAANAYSTNYAGNAEAMPTKSTGSAPSAGCTNYNDVYNYFYAVSWNEFRSSAISAEAAAKTENDNAETTYEPVDNPTEEQINETTETVVQSTSSTLDTTTTTTTTTTTITNETDTSTLDNGTYYVPVESEEEEINETIEDVEYDTYSSAISKKIASLKALRNQVISMAYDTNIDEKVSVKRV